MATFVALFRAGSILALLAVLHLQGCALLSSSCDATTMDSCLANVTSQDICAATDAKVKCVEDTSCCEFKRGGVGTIMSSSDEIVSPLAHDMIFNGSCTFSWATVNVDESWTSYTFCR